MNTPSESTQNATSPFVFEAAALKKDYDDGQVHALRGVDFQIREGEFTAIENVQIPMFENHQSRAARRTRALELLKAVGLEQRVNHFPAKLSGGERQRVAIARSLANSPSVLLADEPTGNLDSESAKHILDLITSLHFDRRMTLILITHDMSVASRASRAIQTKDGQVVFDGDPAKLSRHE